MTKCITCVEVDSRKEGGEVDPRNKGGKVDPRKEEGEIDPRNKGGKVDPRKEGGKVVQDRKRVKCSFWPTAPASHSLQLPHNSPTRTRQLIQPHHRPKPNGSSTESILMVKKMIAFSGC